MNPHPRLETHTCWTLTCTHCHQPWGRKGAPHHHSPTAALTHARTAGWRITATETACPACTATTCTDSQPHNWTGWSEPLTHCGVDYRLRACTTCNTEDYNPPAHELQVVHAALTVIRQANR